MCTMDTGALFVMNGAGGGEGGLRQSRGQEVLGGECLWCVAGRGDLLSYLVGCRGDGRFSYHASSSWDAVCFASLKHQLC